MELRIGGLLGFPSVNLVSQFHVRNQLEMIWSQVGGWFLSLSLEPLLYRWALVLQSNSLSTRSIVRAATVRPSAATTGSDMHMPVIGHLKSSGHATTSIVVNHSLHSLQII